VTIEIRAIGGFEVLVEGIPVPPVSWARRHAAALVKLLAITDGHRLHRERVMAALWPAISVDEATPRLHKAAHFARKALERGAGTITLQHDIVCFDPPEVFDIDVDAFRRLAADALRNGNRDAAARAVELCRGDLLPDDVYDEWVTAARDEVAAMRLELLRLLERWDDLVALDPADEEAQTALARRHAERGDARAALRQLERLEQALRRELGTGLGPDARALKESLEARAGAPKPAQPTLRLIARRDVGDRFRAALASAASGRGTAILLRGPAGVGTTALLDLVTGLADREGFRVARWTASSIEGQWPYGPVIGAFSALCRAHPALLDGLSDQFRSEIERAMSAADLPWSGESAHPRLFLATSELMRLAAEGTGLLLAVDDIHQADDASLRLLHYLSRCARDSAVLIVLAGRPVRSAGSDVLDSIASSDRGALLDVPPLPAPAVERLLLETYPDLDPGVISTIADASGGIPFTALELARQRATDRRGTAPSSLPPDVTRTLQRVAMLGTAFTTDEFLAMCDGDADDAYAQLGQAVSALIVEPADLGHRFRHPMVRDAILDGVPPADLTGRRAEVARRLTTLHGPPARVAGMFLDAGQPAAAVPYVVRAVETAGALGAYRDALSLIDRVVDHAGQAERAILLARRADLLLAMGMPDAVEAYRVALAVTTGTENRLLRARLARILAFGGEFDTARAALAGIQPEGDAADAAILLSQGTIAFFEGDVDAAWKIASLARDRVDLGDSGWQVLDLVALQGLIAHQRGEWFDRFQLELRRTEGRQTLATSVFDAHLCVAEYVLYGQVPYDEIIADAEELRAVSRRAGALRGEAFATALVGEAMLLKGDLDRAETELVEAIALHREIAATTGEAHSMQRLAEVMLARGRRDEAFALLQRALPLARWSTMGLHLIQRIYGTMIVAAPTVEDARAMVDRAEATITDEDRCAVCDVMFAVPATIACADAGDLDAARHYLGVAEESARRFDRAAWIAAVAEARAHVAAAQGDVDQAARLLADAARMFAAAEHHRDAERCRTAVLQPAGAEAQ
jgi:DNA-binding SARP family transcriptional activator/tetratricopeptide (TPR) repeat protein